MGVSGVQEHVLRLQDPHYRLPRGLADSNSYSALVEELARRHKARAKTTHSGKKQTKAEREGEGIRVHVVCGVRSWGGYMPLHGLLS